MTEGLARMKRIRAVHRGSATRMMSDREGLLAADIVDEKISTTQTELGGKAGNSHETR